MRLRVNAPALVVTLLLACFATAVFMLERSTVETYVHTTARVDSVEDAGEDEDGNTVHICHAYFMAGDKGIEMTYEGPGWKGKIVDIMYNPADPHIARRDRFLSNCWLTLIFVPASVLSFLWFLLTSLTDSPSPGARTASRTGRPD